MQRHQLLALAALLIGVASLAGCNTLDGTRYELALPDDLQRLAVDIENYAGEVEIRGDDMPDGVVRIDARRIIENAPADLQNALERATNVEAFIEEQAGGHVLKVRSTSAFPDEDRHYTALLVRVPRLDALRLRNSRGRVEVVQHRGELDIVNHGGVVEIRTDYPVQTPSQILTDLGGIYLQIPLESRIFIDAETLNGDARLNSPDANVSEIYSTGPVLQAQVNEGASELFLRTGSGTVLVEVIKNAGNSRRWFRADEFGPPPERAFTDGTRRHTRNLPDTTQRRDEDVPGADPIPGM